MYRYIEKVKPIDLGFKVKKLFIVDIDKLRNWYNDLEAKYNDWKFVIGDNHHIWQEPMIDPLGITGHYLPDDVYYYTLCWNNDDVGPKTFEQGCAKPEYRDNDNDELNPRECFKGYGLELVNQLPFKSKKWLVTVHTPGTKLVTHQDASDKLRIHIPIYTNNYSNWIIDGEEYHMGVGYAYLVNTTLPHSLINAGDSNRVHLYGKVWTEDVKNYYDLHN